MEKAVEKPAEKTTEELFEEKIKVVLNLIRSNNTAVEAQHITQSLQNAVNAYAAYVVMRQEPKPKKPGAGA